MKSSRVVRSADCQCQSRNIPGFNPTILRLWEAVNEAVLNKVHIGYKKNPPIFNFPQVKIQLCSILILPLRLIRYRRGYRSRGLLFIISALRIPLTEMRNFVCFQFLIPSATVIPKRLCNTDVIDRRNGTPLCPLFVVTKRQNGTKL